MIGTRQSGEKAVLIGISYAHQNEGEAEEYLSELSFLAKTAGAEPLKSFIQKLEMPNPRTFVGTGKI